MNEFLSSILSNLIPLFVTVITALFSYIGLCVKTMLEKNFNEKEKEKIVSETVHYVEQISKSSKLSSAEKFVEAKEKASSWLKERNLKVSDTELDIMIEYYVNHLDK